MELHEADIAPGGTSEKMCLYTEVAELGQPWASNTSLTEQLKQRKEGMKEAKRLPEIETVMNKVGNQVKNNGWGNILGGGGVPVPTNDSAVDWQTQARGSSCAMTHWLSIWTVSEKIGVGVGCTGIDLHLGYRSCGEGSTVDL